MSYFIIFSLAIVIIAAIIGASALIGEIIMIMFIGFDRPSNNIWLYVAWIITSIALGIFIVYYFYSEGMIPAL